MFASSKRKKRRDTTASLDGGGTELNRSRQPSDARRVRFEDDDVSTRDADPVPVRRDTDSTVDRSPVQDGRLGDRDLPPVQSPADRRLRGDIENREIPVGGKIKLRASALRNIRQRNLDLIDREPAKPQLDTAKLKNPNVRREAEKLAARLDKFQTGLAIAQTGGYKILAGLNVEAELQKIFDLADANGDPQMLRQLSDATSFSGKLSLFAPTTEGGRTQVRIVQLFKAVQGDGSYATIRDNIADLATDAKTLRQLARDADLLQGLDTSQYVDENRLLRLVVPNADPKNTKPISETHREWHLEQASLMKAYRELDQDPALQKKLALTMLQSFAKIAPLGKPKAEELGAQVSPFLNDLPIYARSDIDSNPLPRLLQAAYSKDMELFVGSAHLVDNANFREVLAREYAMEGVNTKVGSILEYQSAIQSLFNQAARGQFPDKNVVLDITDLFKLANLPSKEIIGMRDSLERTFLDEAEKFLRSHPAIDQQKFGDMMRQLQIGAMVNHKGVDVLLVPPFLFRSPNDSDTPLQTELLKKTDPDDKKQAHTQFFNAIEHSKIHTGYRLDPLQAKKAWLEVESPAALLKTHGIQLTTLATADTLTPKVFNSFEDFTKHGTFKQFASLATAPGAPPYAKALSKATVNLLNGLKAYNPDQGGVDQAMREQGLNEVLQTAYFRMLNALAAAVDSQALLNQSQGRLDPSELTKIFVNYMNQIEVVQQQMATIISLIEPYSDTAFGDSIRARLTDPAGPGGKPVIPAGLDKAGVQLKPSAMHCLASILSSVEAVKKSNKLNVCVVKDHYYESTGAIGTAQTYSRSEFDGDAVRGTDGTRKPLDPASIKGQKPLDLYVCDFHHNISLGRNHYQIEDLQHHVDELYRNNLVAGKFTVAIDSTIDFINSKDIQAFLEHNKDRITSGKLNVVLFRSAQKFDMLGMDNYYGGFAVNINSHAAFADFNTRMADPEDQLKGPSLQGLSHIGVDASQDTDEYRQALMSSTKRFYDALPQALIWSPGSTSAMQVARTDDPNAVFLDIKFPENAAASDAFVAQLKEFAKQKGLPLTGRASFGFATTNLNLIHGEKTRLTPGLEGPEIQDRYIAFFKAVHQRANDAERQGQKKGLTGEDLKKFIAEQIKTMPLDNIR